jgi:hypothetical protein
VWSGGLNDAGQLGHSPDSESVAVRLGIIPHAWLMSSGCDVGSRTFVGSIDRGGCNANIATCFAHPAQTLQRVDLPDPVTAVTAGHYHTLALTTSGKRLQCHGGCQKLILAIAERFCRVCNHHPLHLQVTYGPGVGTQLASLVSVAQESLTCASPSEWSRSKVYLLWASESIVAGTHTLLWSLCADVPMV